MKEPRTYRLGAYTIVEVVVSMGLIATALLLGLGGLARLDGVWEREAHLATLDIDAVLEGCRASNGACRAVSGVLAERRPAGRHPGLYLVTLRDTSEGYVLGEHLVYRPR